MITQYDIIRTLPSGGQIVLAEMKGSLLLQVLQAGAQYPGNRSFLQYDKISKNKKGEWLLSGKKINDGKVYHVAIDDYLVSGQQQYLEYFETGKSGNCITYLSASGRQTEERSHAGGDRLFEKRWPVNVLKIIDSLMLLQPEHAAIAFQSYLF